MFCSIDSDSGFLLLCLLFRVVPPGLYHCCVYRTTAEAALEKSTVTYCELTSALLLAAVGPELV